MLTNPKIDQLAQVWYRASVRDKMPYHGRVGRVMVVGKGRPRNHGVLLDGQIISVPCGNLRKPQNHIADVGKKVGEAR